MDDQEILALFLQRDEQAIEELHAKYGAYLGTIAFRVLEDQSAAEEVVNDTLLAVWNRVPPEKPRVLRHYISRIARNLALKKLEYAAAAKRSGEALCSLDELAECLSGNEQSTESCLEEKELGAEISAWLRSLSAEDRRIFILRYYYMLPIKEIGEKCNLPERRVKYRLSALREALKTHLEQKGWLE